MRNARLCSILLSDPIPIWVKLQRGREVFMASEVQRQADKARKRKLLKEAALEAAEAQGEAASAAEAVEEGSDEEVSADEEVAGESAATEGYTRTTGDSAAEKCRITLDHMQVILDYCDPLQTPKGSIGLCSLVVQGCHARLSNIDTAGKWICSEQFEVGGVTVQRTAGKSAGRVLMAWRKLGMKHQSCCRTWRSTANPLQSAMQ